ncbi:MAG: HAMP domain-containing histidine kinase [Leptospirales bacterium]|nr:HAMP domain-containing histidine kinase [Leptospirales bacterium]
MIFFEDQRRPGETFLRDLDEQCDRLLPFATCLGIVVWLPYITLDSHLHPGQPAIVWLRLGFSALSAICLLIRALFSFPFRGLVVGTLFLSYLQISCGILTGLASADPIYVGGYVFVIMILPVTPVPRSILISLLAISVGSFVLTLSLVGFPAESMRTAYSRSDLIASLVVSSFLIYAVGSWRMRSWTRSRLLLEAGDREAELRAKAESGFRDAEALARQLQQKLGEKEKMAAIGDMAAGIVHDLKNPVSVIQGAVEMACDPLTTQDERGRLHAMVDAETERILSLVQDLLDFSRGGVQVSKEPVQVDQYISRVRTAIGPLFEGRDVQCRVTCQYPGEARFDPNRFLRVIMNISANAADVLRSGGHFDIDVCRNNGSLRFTLSDNGPGIPESIRATLFEPFITHGKSNGTGLGMAIAKSMVEAHGGVIKFETETGKGTQFTIEVPV